MSDTTTGESPNPFTLDADLTALAEFYGKNGWAFLTAEGRFGKPTPEDLQIVVENLGTMLEGDKKIRWGSHARLVVLRDPDFPTGYEVLVTVGRLETKESQKELKRDPR